MIIVKIMIADDHELFVQGVLMLLKDQLTFKVIDIASNGRELLDLLSKKTPDILLLDINMPDLNGLEVLKFLKISFPGIKTIMLSTYDDSHLIEKSKELGAYAYLLKNINKEKLVETIKLVEQGQPCFPGQKRAEHQMLNEFDAFLKQFNLTKREYEILGLVKEELTNIQMANRLNLSIYTIETHRKNIMLKLRLNSPAALMKFIVTQKI